MTYRVALVIDDESQIRRAVRRALEEDFERVHEAESGGKGLDVAAAAQPELIVLDLGLPDTTGIALCKELRKWSKAAILVLSARHEDEEKIALLDAGADDYLTKPFNTLELQARARALLRRTSAREAEGSSSIRCGSLVMDLAARTVTRDGGLVHLTPIEWELLRALMTSAGKTLTHRQLFASVWPGRSEGDAQQYLRVHVANLRRKIEENPIEPRYIFTEPGVGYRFASIERAKA
jgi:two-component system KDP operon response regulator KdpE